MTGAGPCARLVLVQGRPIAAPPVSTNLAGGSWEVARCSGPKAPDGPTLVLQALELTLGFGHLFSSSLLLARLDSCPSQLLASLLTAAPSCEAGWIGMGRATALDSALVLRTICCPCLRTDPPALSTTPRCPITMEMANVNEASARTLL